ncbi:hypothetical protein Tco_1021581 [Tanacetum coccineum]
MVTTRNTTSYNEKPNHNDTSSPSQNPNNLAQQLYFIASKLNALDALAADVAVLKEQTGPNGSNRGKLITLGSRHGDDDSKKIASMYLEGDALDLFAWISAEQNLLYWEE